MICASIGAADNQEMLRRISLAESEPASLYELRFDDMLEAPAVEELVTACRRPVMATCRAGRGASARWDSPDERAAVLRRAATAGAVYVHGEAKDLERLERFKSIIRIAGMRDTAGTPADLADQALKLCSANVDWVLFAVTAITPSDNIRVFEALSACTKPAVGYAMGDVGLVSRVLGPRYGSRIVFGGLDGEQALEPGQPTVRELADHYRIHSLGGKTDVYAMFDPDYSRSDSFARHNLAFKELGMDAVCIPLFGAGSRDFNGVMAYLSAGQ